MAESSSTIFVGRQKELNQLLDSLYNERKIVTIVSSESGMGKSALLLRLYNELKEKERGSSTSSSFLVGFYDRNKALVGGSASMIYPFAIALESLLVWLKDTTDYSDEFKGLIKRTQGALIKTLRDEASNILVALVDDVAKKFGFEQTLGVVKKFYKNFKEEKTSIALAEQSVAENQQEAIFAYMTIVESLANEFVDRKFVFIFDQFEMVRKASIDFLINFVARMPENNFHVIVSFKVEERAWSDTVARQLYEYAKEQLTDLGAKNIGLEGLSAEEIGEWIKAVRKVELPPKDLQIIRERSGWFPFLLSNWITRASSKLDYDQIDRNRYCELVKQRFKRLNGEDEKIKLNKLSILQYPYPLETEQMAHFLEMDLDHLQLFLDEVISIGVFEQRGKYQWFRHELAQYCISSSLLPAIKKTAHKYAADFYLKQLDISSNSSTTGGESKIALNNTTIGCAYHLHEAGLHKESLDFNVKLAAYAARIWELDLAERCYLRAIEDAVNLGDDKSKMDLIFELTRNIYYTWGRYEESVENYKQLLKYYSENGNEGNLAVTLNNLGIIYQKRGEYEAALEKYNESLEIAEKLGNQKRYALIIRQIGTLLRTIENYKDAIACLYSAYNIFDELKLDPEKQFALQNIQEIRDKIGENEFNVIIQSLYSDEKHD